MHLGLTKFYCTGCNLLQHQLLRCIDNRNDIELECVNLRAIGNLRLQQQRVSPRELSSDRVKIDQLTCGHHLSSERVKHAHKHGSRIGRFNHIEVEFIASVYIELVRLRFDRVGKLSGDRSAQRQFGCRRNGIKLEFKIACKIADAIHDQSVLPRSKIVGRESGDAVAAVEEDVADHRTRWAFKRPTHLAIVGEAIKHIGAESIDGEVELLSLPWLINRASVDTGN